MNEHIGYVISPEGEAVNERRRQNNENSFRNEAIFVLKSLREEINKLDQARES
jgi:hypothetical protein